MDNLMWLIVAVVFLFILRRVIHAQMVAREKQAVKSFLRGAGPSKTLADIGYEFHPSIIYISSGLPSLWWPDFQRIGGGSRELFDHSIIFGYNNLSGPRRLEYVCVVGRLADVKEWYDLTLEERGKLLTSRLSEEYVQRNFR